jgi:hypothetical protein
VNHALPRLEHNVHTSPASPLGQPLRVVEQRFRGTNLDQQGRESCEVSVKRRGQRGVRVLARQV